MPTQPRSLWRATVFFLLAAYFPSFVLSDNFQPVFGKETPDQLIETDLLLFDPGLTNLEENPQNFVLDVKKIEIEEYPESFNPSILQWNNSLLLSFRIRNPKANTTNEIGLIFLNEEFEPISKAYVLEMRLPPRSRPAKEQDPRLFCLDDRLYMIYSAILDQPTEKESRRVHIAQIHWDGECFYVDETQSIEKYPGQNPLRWEKNWVPFIYENELLLAYSQIPHRILRPALRTDTCTAFCSSISLIQWAWGVLRGGTQAFLVDGEYLSFFHSSINMASVQSQGKIMQHYFMGAYTFSASPPFEITRISKEPIVGKNFYNGPIYKTWKPLRVVFPGGFAFDNRYVWVVYGRQDHELWVVKLDKQGLFNSLIPVNSSKR